MLERASNGYPEMAEKLQRQQQQQQQDEEHQQHQQQSQQNRDETQQITYLLGWKFHMVFTAIGLAVCLVNMEVTIVSTSLLTISNDFGDFDQSNWIVIAYLSTYSGLLITWSKLSDIYQRKSTFVTALLIFMAFSAGCGASQSMTQLIICRAFQGIGASGMFSVSLVMFYELVPKPKYPLYSSFITTITAISALGGPIIGGAIDTRSTWRWIFFLNIPAAAIILAIFLLVLPGSFPYHGQENESLSTQSSISHNPTRLVDFIGAFLLLAASLLLATALLEASTVFAWSSAFTISLLIVSVLFYAVFFAWERFISLRNGYQQPIFPWQLIRNRVWMGVLGTSFLTGVLPMAVVVIVPQRFQIVSRESPLDSGLQLLAYTISVPIGNIVASIIAGKTRVLPIALLYAGVVLQILGLGLMLSLPSTGAPPASEYVFEVIVALGIGGMFGLLLLVNPYCVDKKYLATATGALAQLRMIGMTIGLAAATSALNGQLTAQLAERLSPAQLRALLQNIAVAASFSPHLQEDVQVAFSQGFGLQIKVLLGIAAFQFVTVSLMWQSPQLRLLQK